MKLKAAVLRIIQWCICMLATTSRFWPSSTRASLAFSKRPQGLPRCRQRPETFLMQSPGRPCKHTAQSLADSKMMLIFVCLDSFASSRLVCPAAIQHFEERSVTGAGSPEVSPRTRERGHPSTLSIKQAGKRSPPRQGPRGIAVPMEGVPDQPQGAGSATNLSPR
jgi:hypothetical protein